MLSPAFLPIISGTTCTVLHGPIARGSSVCGLPSQSPSPISSTNRLALSAVVIISILILIPSENGSDRLDGHAHAVMHTPHHKSAVPTAGDIAEQSAVNRIPDESHFCIHLCCFAPLRMH